MNIKIIYPEKAKKCKKVAYAIGEKFGISVVAVDESPVIADCDLLIIVGGGPYSGENNVGMEPFVKQLQENAVKMAAIITLDAIWRNVSVADIHNVKANQMLVRKILQEKNIDVVDEHMCETRFYFFCIGHPNNDDIYRTNKWLENVLKIAGNRVKKVL